MVSPISKQVYHDAIKGKLEVTQNEKIVAFLINKPPMTNRMIHAEIKDIEFGDLKRCTHSLTYGKGCPVLLEVVYYKPCPITGRTVNWYQLRSIQQTLFK